MSPDNQTQIYSTCVKSHHRQGRHRPVLVSTINRHKCIKRMQLDTYEYKYQAKQCCSCMNQLQTSVKQSKSLLPIAMSKQHLIGLPVPVPISSSYKETLSLSLNNYIYLQKLNNIYQ